MIDAAGSMQTVVAIIAPSNKRVVAITATICVAILRYNMLMPKKPAPPAKLKPINRWVVDAMEFANLSQAELSRQLHARNLIGDDRSVANKISLGKREVSANEAIAIAEITKFPPLNEAVQSSLLQVPHLSWVSAGAMMKHEFADETIGTIEIGGLPDGDWIALTVTGDSMDRISPPDSIIFVNRNDKRLAPNACYIIDDGEGSATYKRYRPGPMRFEPVSTNKDLEPLFPDNEPTVIGRVGLSMIKM